MTYGQRSKTLAAKSAKSYAEMQKIIGEKTKVGNYDFGEDDDYIAAYEKWQQDGSMERKFRRFQAERPDTEEIGARNFNPADYF